MSLLNESFYHDTRDAFVRSPKTIIVIVFSTYRKPLSESSGDIVKAVSIENLLYHATSCSISTPHGYTKSNQ